MAEGPGRGGGGGRGGRAGASVRWTAGGRAATVRLPGEGPSLDETGVVLLKLALLDDERKPMSAEEPDEAMSQLAVRARTVLAGARHALLTLPGPRVRGWTGLIDDGGEPVLLVGADSPPA